MKSSNTTRVDKICGTVWLCLLAITLSLVGCSGVDSDSRVESCGVLPQLQNNHYARNIYSPTDADQHTIKRKVVAAWKNFKQAREDADIDSGGFGPGLTEQQLNDIESRLRQRLPVSVREFLKIHAGGKFVGLNLMTPDEIVEQWREYTGICSTDYFNANQLYAFPADEFDSECFESFHVPLMQEHLQTLMVDIRNGSIVMNYDMSCWVIAESIIEFTNKCAERIAEGKLYNIDGVVDFGDFKIKNE